MKDAKQTPVIAGAKANVSLFAAGEDSTAAKAYDSVRAILVGINQYKSGFNLKGAVNDVRGFAQLLGEKNRVLAKETAIKLLTDRQATKSAITKELSHLIEVTAANDACIIYFSGIVLIEEDQNGKHKSMFPHDQEYEKSKNGISIPWVISELGKAKGTAIVIVDG
jgi:hypothetical protein